MTQPSTQKPTAEQIEATVASLRSAYDHLTELTDTAGGLNALTNTSRGTAALHDLRKEIDRLHKLLPFKG